MGFIMLYPSGADMGASALAEVPRPRESQNPLGFEARGSLAELRSPWKGWEGGLSCCFHSSFFFH